MKFIYPFLKDSPLTDLAIIQQTTFPENNSVYIEWLTPIDPNTKQEEEVVEYRVQWGPLWRGSVERIVWKEGEEYITQVNLLVSHNTSVKCPVGEGGRDLNSFNPCSKALAGFFETLEVGIIRFLYWLNLSIN